MAGQSPLTVLDCVLACFVRLLFGNRARVRLRFRLFRLRLCWVQGSRRDIGMMLRVALYSPWCRRVEAVGGVTPQLYADS